VQNGRRATFSWPSLYYSRPAYFSEYFLFLVDYVVINTWIQTQMWKRKPLLAIPFVIADLIQPTYFFYLSELHLCSVCILRKQLENNSFPNKHWFPKLLCPSTKRSYTSTILCYYNKNVGAKGVVCGPEGARLADSRVPTKPRKCHLFLPSPIHACPHHGPWATY
jgi:hypothetical protein